MNIPKTTFSFVFYFIRQQWLKFSVLIFIFIAWGTNDSLFPYFLKRIINTLHEYHGDPHGIYAAESTMLILLFVCWGLTELLMRIQGILLIYTFPKMRASIRSTVFDYVTSHSHEYFSSQFAGNIAKKLADLPSSCQTILEIICFQFVTAATGVAVVLIMMWLTKPLFAGILISWLCFHMILTVLFLRRGNELYEIHSDSVSELSGKIVDILSNMLNVRLFARRRFESQYLEGFQREEIVKGKRAMWIVEIMRIGLGINGILLMFGMIFALLYCWVHHTVTIGDFTQIIMQSFWLLGWIWFTSYQLTVFARELGTIRNALAIIQKGHDIVDVKEAKPLIINQGKIVFEDVTFAYHLNKPVFDHFNVAISAGQKIGLVGFSGSGKSTFVNLILRFYDIQQGRILIDDQNLATVTQESLRSQIAMIPQDPALFHRTLMENIRYGRLESTDEEVIQAAKLAHCHEFIEKLDEGYQSLVGERGVKLSGGQRQRIAIARAILKNAPIIILDEATSSLDTVTEKLIQESLHFLMERRTTIVVAHRLSTLIDMDKILVFHHGKIIEEGNKDELLSKGGHFAKLWNMQTDGFLPDEKE